MAITVNQAFENMRHTLGGGELSVELDKLGIMNQAGEYLVNMHAWRWLVGRTELIDLRGAVSGSTATWTFASLTITETGAFANYTFVAGDQIEIESGTSVTTGFYKVASRTDDDSIVLSTSINATDGSAITWNIQTNTASLPDDFRDIISISATDSLLYGVQMTSLAQILRNRTSQIEVSTSWDYQGAIAWAGTPPVPILELWPNPTANQAGVFSIFFRAGWSRITTDSTQISVPEFIDSLYMRLVRAFARGYEREDEAPMSVRLAQIRMGDEFRAAARRDGLTQETYGKLRGGGMMTHSRRFRAGGYNSIATRVAAPS